MSSTHAEEKHLRTTAPEPYYQDDLVTIYNCDWRELLPLQPDLVLTDPPYGVKVVGQGRKNIVGAVTNTAKTRRMHISSRGIEHEPVLNDHSPDEAKAAVEQLSFVKKQIWWGGNYYASALGDASCWLVWDKVADKGFMADVELAWTNFDRASCIFRHQWLGIFRASESGLHFHPTQKPVALMNWCIQKAKLKPNSLVFDPFMGAGPVAVAAKAQGHRYVGCELVEKYCEIAAKRCAQDYLFGSD